MEENTIIEKIKNMFLKNLICICIILMIIIIILLLLPNKTLTDNKKTEKNSTLSLTLQGNVNITILKGEKYIENGYFAYDSKEGDLTNKVKVEGVVNENIVGSYTLKYHVENKEGKIAETIRNIKVVADLSDVKIELDYEPKSLTNQFVTINLKISGDGYDFTLIPDGNISKLTEIKYKVSVNDEYLFSIKKKDGNVVEKKIKINNIDLIKPTGNCKSVVTTDKTEVTVNASDSSGIQKYIYTFGGNNYDSNSNKYSIKGIYRTVSVTVYDKASNYEVIKCDTVDNTWPTTITAVSGSSETPQHYNQNLHYNNLNYILYYPNNLNLSNKNPLVVFLHGGGECGSNIYDVFNSNTAFVNNMKSGIFKGAFFLAPQCNCQGAAWTYCYNDLKGLIDKIVTEYNIDNKRISISGHSWGGIGTYKMLEKYPNFFSAAALLAPSVGSVDYTNLKNVKIVVFTGTEDDLYYSSKTTAENLKSNGINIKFYPVNGVGHSVQPYVFNNTNTIEWMIAQSR